MKISLVHPLKHHAYEVGIGLLNSKYDFSAVLGIYDNNNLINKIIKTTKYKQHIKGYRN